MSERSSRSEDLLRAPFTTDNANRISQRITSWRLLAPFLGLDKRDEEEVGRERSLGEQRVKMMEVWRHKFGGDATYLRFVRGCEEAQRRDLVGAVYSLVQQPASKEEEGEGEGGCGGSLRLGQAPKLFELLLFTGRSGRRYRVLERIAPFWEELAFALGFESYVTEAIKRSSMFQVNDCCRAVLQRWLQGSSVGPVTWETLLSAMEEVEEVAVLTAELRAEM